MSGGPRAPAGEAAADLARASSVLAARGLGLGVPLAIAEETGSTNDDAKRGARDGAPHGSVWLAESQTAGRGRQGRTWLSRRGENLLFSVLLRLRCAPARVPPVSLACGLAVRDAVARALGTSSADGDVLVKWPNDVLVRSPRDGVLRKVAGVLVESALTGQKVEYVVVGIGINVRSQTLPDAVAAIATSIALERDARGVGATSASASDATSASASDVDRAEILADVLAGLERDVEHVAQKGLGSILARLTRYDALAGRRVESIDDSGAAGALEGIASGIDADGRLVVKREDGTFTKVSSGEIRLRAT